MNEQQIKLKAKGFRERLGGTIFAFPVEEDNPFSDYAVVVYREGMYFVYPQASDVSEAASGVLVILDCFQKEGINADYEKNVRFISHQAQVDAPSVTMRRLRKNNAFDPLIQKDKDFREGNEKTGPLLSARGVIKLTYLSMVEDKTPKAIRVMEEYYKLLALKRYGKTAAAIKQDVHRMKKVQAIKWIEQTFERFIKDDSEIFSIFNRIG